MIDVLCLFACFDSAATQSTSHMIDVDVDDVVFIGSADDARRSSQTQSSAFGGVGHASTTTAASAVSSSTTAASTFDVGNFDIWRELDTVTSVNFSFLLSESLVC